MMLRENLSENKYIQFSEKGDLILPNIKKMVIPDEGMEMFDADLSGADIMVVAADSECKWLLDFFSKPQKKKVYAYIASMFLDRDVSDKSDEYKLFKSVFHGANYKLGVKKLSSMTGLPILRAQALLDYYFKLNPEIKQWHLRLENQVRKYGYVENIFGRRMEFLDLRNPNLMNEVCASIPQSTIGDVINEAWIQITDNVPEIDILLQTHDSLTGQYPILAKWECNMFAEGKLIRVESMQDNVTKYHKLIKKYMKVDIPYDPILNIDSDIKVSRLSYGEMDKVKL